METFFNFTTNPDVHVEAVGLTPLSHFINRDRPSLSVL